MTTPIARLAGVVDVKRVSEVAGAAALEVSKSVRMRGVEAPDVDKSYVARSTTWAQPAEPPPLLAAVPAGRVRFGPAGWDPAALQQPPSWVELEPERGVLAS